MFNKSKILSFLLCFCLLFEQTGLAQSAGALDISNHITALRNSFVQDKYRPLHLRYLGYDAKSNDFKLLLDNGDFLKSFQLPVTTSPEEKKLGTADLATGDFNDLQLKQETNKLMQYFFIGLTLPNESFRVNLRPRHKASAGEADSESIIMDSELEKTDVGKIMLEADVQLKKDTALYTSPQTTEGRKYWDKLYKKAEELYGYDNITIPTLTRPWIVPGEIIIRETPDNAYIYKATLKVMLEEDYLKTGQSVSLRGAVATKQSYNKIASPLARNGITELGNNILDTEWLQIEKMISSGITPSPERIREYLMRVLRNTIFVSLRGAKRRSNHVLSSENKIAALPLVARNDTFGEFRNRPLINSCQDEQSMDRELNKVICCIAAITRLEEGNAVVKSKWKELLSLIESNMRVNQLRLKLKQLVFSPN